MPGTRIGAHNVMGIRIGAASCRHHCAPHTAPRPLPPNCQHRLRYRCRRLLLPVHAPPVRSCTVLDVPAPGTHGDHGQQGMDVTVAWNECDTCRSMSGILTMLSSSSDAILFAAGTCSAASASSVLTTGNVPAVAFPPVACSPHDIVVCFFPTVACSSHVPILSVFFFWME